jgi:chloramphenicol-sensitive protein RarD
MWGVFPLCFPLLAPAGPLEILAHRMIWSLVVVGVILAGIRRWQWIPELLRQPRRLALLALAATVISVNWGMYIWGVNSGHVMVSLALAFSFGTYGLVKEKANMGGLEPLAAETSIQFLPALAFVLVLSAPSMRLSQGSPSGCRRFRRCSPRPGSCEDRGR